MKSSFHLKVTFAQRSPVTSFWINNSQNVWDFKIQWICLLKENLIWSYLRDITFESKSLQSQIEAYINQRIGQMKGMWPWDGPITFSFYGCTALSHFISSLHTKIKQGAKNKRESRFIWNPSKPLSNKRSHTMNPALWNGCKQGLHTHSYSMCTDTHTVL